MEQIAFRERGTGVSVSAVHAENATIFRYRCGFAIRYILHDDGDIELCI